MVREFAGTARLQTYLYRFAIPNGSDLALQAITPGAPDLNPISQWTWLSGAQSRLQPGTVIVVGFAGNDWATPYIVSFNPMGVPLEIDVGGNVTPVNLAGGAGFLATGVWATALQTILTTFLAGLNPITLPGQALAALAALAPLTGTQQTILTKAT